MILRFNYKSSKIYYYHFSLGIGNRGNHCVCILTLPSKIVRTSLEPEIVLETRVVKTDEPFIRTVAYHRNLVSRLSPILKPANVSHKDYRLITVYKPIDASDGPLPTILYVPGNAFVASETGYTHFICSHIAEYSRCQVIVIKHALAPEHQFPIGFQNVKNTVHALLSDTENPFALKIDKTRVAITGYSSGGNLAALMTIEAKKQNIPIARQILISPITDLSRSLKGFENYEQADTAISEQFVKWFLDLYIPKGFASNHPKLSPLWKNERELQKLPPTDIVFGEMDRFRGDSESYGDKLARAGNVVHSLKVKQQNHGFLWHNVKVINAISARLALSFGTEPIEKPLKSTESKHPVTILHLEQKPKETEKNKPRL